jgi:hypothetical protein
VGLADGSLSSPPVVAAGLLRGRHGGSVVAVRGWLQVACLWDTGDGGLLQWSPMLHAMFASWPWVGRLGLPFPHQAVRDLGAVVFLLLRDATGTIQLKVDSELYGSCAHCNPRSAFVS